MQQSHSVEPDPRWDELKSRCAEAKLNCNVAELGQTQMQIGLVGMAEPGVDRLPVLVSQASIDEFLAIEFEKFRLVGNYHAIFCVDEGFVEAFLAPASSGVPVSKLLQQSVSKDNAERDGENDDDGAVELAAGSVSIRLGSPSRELMILTGERKAAGRGADGASIRISGLSDADRQAPNQALERVSDAVLFQFDTKFKQAIVLSRNRPFRFPGSREDGGSLAFPTSEFDREPMSLYWYGRGAEGLPLLEFFAYYQVLEFYFDHYVDADGRRRISAVLRDPGFEVHDDRHIVRVLRAAGRGSNSRRNERDQLLTTIRGCADAAAIRSYISEDEARKKFFAGDDATLTTKIIRPSVGDGELLQQVADRIYDLRCKIVHTKETGSGSEGVELLLPHSPEADRMDRDINLLRLIARQALVAASRPMSIGAEGT